MVHLVLANCLRQSFSGVHRYPVSMYHCNSLTLKAKTMSHSTQPSSLMAGPWAIFTLEGWVLLQRQLLKPHPLLHCTQESISGEQWEKWNFVKCLRQKNDSYKLPKITGRNRMDKLKFTSLSWSLKHNWSSKYPFSKQSLGNRLTS